MHDLNQHPHSESWRDPSSGVESFMLAAAHGVDPRNTEVRKLQQAMLRSGYCLGDEARLAELGLDCPAGKEGPA